MYNFNKIKNCKDARLLPGEEMIWLTGTEESFDTIREKYIWLNENSKYGSTDHCDQTIKHLLREKAPLINSCLDIGCGTGHFLSWVTDNLCKEVYGLDFAITGLASIEEKGVQFLKANAHEIPLPDKSIDLITSFDFLEHVHPEYLEKTIKEMQRVCRRFMIHKIESRPSKFMHKEVGQLHLIQEHEKWWVDYIFKPISKQTTRIEKRVYLLEL